MNKIEIFYLPWFSIVCFQYVFKSLDNERKTYSQSSYSLVKQKIWLLLLFSFVFMLRSLTRRRLFREREREGGGSVCVCLSLPIYNLEKGEEKEKKKNEWGGNEQRLTHNVLPFSIVFCMLLCWEKRNVSIPMALAL